MKEHVYLGVDIGGTNVKCARIGNSRIVKRNHSKTKASEGFEVSLQQILDTIEPLSKNINGIGVGIAGIVDTKHGTVRYSPNMPGWDNIPLASLIRKKFGVPVHILNDVNAFCLGEWQYGAARGCKDVFLLTVGTGVGGGAVCNGEPQFGAHGFAGEIGHMIIKENGRQCVCGNHGCLEAYVGAKPMQRLARTLRRNKKSALHQLDRITPRTIAREAKKGDRVACEVYRTIGTHLGVAITSIVHLYDPEVIVISGGIAQAGRLLFDPIKKVVAQQVMGGRFRTYRIVPPQLGNDAGMLGAVYYASSVRRKA